MSSGAKSSFYLWRDDMVASSLPSTTKLILHTLACRMSHAEESCFPSIGTIGAEASLSNRVVCEHIKKAVALGWIQKQKSNLTGQKWARNEYEISRKYKALAQSKNQKANEIDTNSPDNVVTSTQEGSDFYSTKVVTESQTNNKKNKSKKIADKKETILEGTLLSDDWELTQEYIDAALSIRTIDMDELHSIAKDFKDYWLAKTGERAASRNWLATWRKWIRRQRTEPAVTIVKQEWKNT